MARYLVDLLFLERDPQLLVLKMSKIEAWIIFSHLQLALRHPANNGRAAEIARKWAKAIEQSLAVTPALVEVAARGWEGRWVLAHRSMQLSKYIVARTDGKPLPPDEPLFVLRAQDVAALPAIQEYRQVLLDLGYEPESPFIQQIDRIMAAFKAWPRLKMPD